MFLELIEGRCVQQKVGQRLVGAGQQAQAHSRHVCGQQSLSLHPASIQPHPGPPILQEEEREGERENEEDKG